MFKLWTDGTVINHVGGWAALIWEGDADPNPNRVNSYTGAEIGWGATSSRMEIMAVLGGLRELPVGAEVYLFTDSAYVASAIEKGYMYEWKRNGWHKDNGDEVKETDIWVQIELLCRSRIVHATWVPSHKNNRLNNLADARAREAADLCWKNKQAFKQPPELAPRILWREAAKCLPPWPQGMYPEEYLVALVGNTKRTQGKTLIRKLAWKRKNICDDSCHWVGKPRGYAIKAWSPFPFGWELD